ncbi:MAG: Acetolactate synthase, small subunit [Methanosarcinales archeaon 56_1174]|nr:MAG: Acetolactate synthase, small subunit [Methanosarcinales archeaon 56_1174]MDN5295470.1 acetolactate synthase small subunit [Methanosarcinales archaeon]
MNMKHTLAVLVENKSGVLARVAGLFARRGYNIDSLAVGVTENPEISRMTIVVRGDDRVLEQVSKQLNKLIDVIKVSDLPSEESVERELALFKVAADASTRPAIMQLVDVFRANIIDVSKRSLIIEITGDEEKINAMESLLRDFGILEMCRTGRIAMSRGLKSVVYEDEG